MSENHQSDVLIIGGGLAGIVAAIELLDTSSHRILLLDRDVAEKFGGLAKESFGGVTMFDTPHQRRTGIRDSRELAHSDWMRTAEFEEHDHWPKRWAEHYIERSVPDIYEWLTQRGVKFFPVVHWVERGMFRAVNSVPRFHMVWGTGQGLIEALLEVLERHPKRSQLEIRFEHEVEALTEVAGRVVGCTGKTQGRPFEIRAGLTLIASGGICGSVDRVKKNWWKPWGTPPEVILNGSHRYADGKMLDAAEARGAKITHLDIQWNYAAGVHHPRPNKPLHGLSLVPCRSALWMNYRGERIGPVPLVGSFDTRYLVEQICKQERKYTWQVMNQKIAVKELAVSGSEFNDAIRNKNFLGFLATIMFGNRSLVSDLSQNCKDFVVAETLPELVQKMNQVQGDSAVQLDVLEREIRLYDDMIDRGERYHDDDQLRRIAHVRQYRGDRLRTCRFQKILDPSAGPLIAIREFILSRKSLGGVQTDLYSRALDQRGNPIPGLFVVGEAAGFGGGGLHGKGALEGTFLGGCVITAQAAARAIAGGKA